MIYQAAMRSAAGASTFSPSGIAGLQLWLDASDESTITASSGAVSQWDDKSGNGSHAVQGTAAQQPDTGIATINSKNVIRFDSAANHALQSPTVDLSGNTDKLTAFIVARTTLNGGTRVLLEHGPNSNDTPQTPLLYKSTGDKIVSTIKQTDGTASTFENSTVVNVAAGAFLVSATYDGSLTTSEWGTRVNGSGAGTFSANNNLTLTLQNQTMNIGSRNESLIFWDGDIAEIRVYSAALSTADRDANEADLATKWGITL